MTPTDILTDIRYAISDETGVRWLDAALRTYMYDAELKIVQRHPESQYHTKVAAISTPTSLSSNDSSFTIGVRWRNAMIHYVAFRVFSEDADDAANHKLAMEHFKLFEEAMA